MLILWTIPARAAPALHYCDYSSAYTFADGTWDFNGFSRHLLHERWITKVDDDDDQWVKAPFTVASLPLAKKPPSEEIVFEANSCGNGLHRGSLLRTPKTKTHQRLFF